MDKETEEEESKSGKRSWRVKRKRKGWLWFLNVFAVICLLV